MPKTITIDPVTRIEGHARITITLDDRGLVEDCRLHVTQLRGFEAFCVGRPLAEMPSLTARTCGICPVSHLLASAKACDELLAVRIPPAAVRLRQLLNYGQLVQSHALSFFHLASPDLLLGMDAAPEQRNIFGLAAARPEVAKEGIALRRFGQQLIERLAGKRIHPDWVVPGGVSRPLSRENGAAIAAELPGMLQAAQNNLVLLQGVLENFTAEIAHFANFPSGWLALAGEAGQLEYYDGPLRLLDQQGEELFSEADPLRYQQQLAEQSEADSYLKSPYHRPQGPEAGLYRVGPLARLNAARRCGTPLADEALAAFRELSPQGPVTSSFHYHYARLIEIIHGLEKIQQLLADDTIYDPRVRATAGANAPEGVGICEAPRGTLIHHYRIDEQGRISAVNMMIATGHNSLAIQRGLKQAARAFINGNGENDGESGKRAESREIAENKEIREGLLNRIEAVLRCYDPCLSCSTHALGQMPLAVELRTRRGALIHQLNRGN
ncbi:Ni/Fe hydrogenase subunit alpha [Desulfurivibrio alkaliphilus]|uniref:Nickel-dependent hydrogenase large subunit n=1 Tax=Desulfurivibrio alkaliphilus (strain DSM 19089 / UNIQEM U267 / AHT2) TaxID=589865 RepID=D6Z3I9_DESAT|nr:Ni/Fe hydrogenase subunit alpha [Desulfurivibrio alkaliphilus]ADH86114.1 nickel-dependent hydrogenase large subunit [Desulfurivibrio alkaliphilus AHT 2]